MHIHPHKFRHSQASILYVVDIVTISKRLGHKQVSTTQYIYAHMIEKSDKEVSDKIADILFRNQEKEFAFRHKTPYNILNRTVRR